MAKKQKTVGQLKKELWKIFSKLIKLRYSEDGEHCPCFTCGRVMKIGDSSTHAGHWMPKGGYSYLYFHECNVRPQCYHCNINLSGNSEVFRRNLEIEVGTAVIEEMFENRHKIEKRGRQWYLDQIEYYKDELKLQESCF